MWKLSLNLCVGFCYPPNRPCPQQHLIAILSFAKCDRIVDLHCPLRLNELPILSWIEVFYPVLRSLIRWQFQDLWSVRFCRFLIILWHWCCWQWCWWQNPSPTCIRSAYPSNFTILGWFSVFIKSVSYSKSARSSSMRSWFSFNFRYFTATSYPVPLLMSTVISALKTLKSIKSWFFVPMEPVVQGLDSAGNIQNSAARF